ncbi:hypothetical protein F8388_008166 [Cannabis sativa]|uniref:Prolamin-like domain-containing protein n=1 Tax=Cannabis sativa TaxID=3483 RepID=A0A7J6H7P7_CANSA|nr:hypothetical protein F8388_008166 [Cannabis sativa]KAF4391307.1 hypothetical protein G4B88_016617 [Cannabis sativa]
MVALSFCNAQHLSSINKTYTSCEELQQLQPCSANIFSFFIRKQPINSTCCESILSIANKCSGDLMPIWFLKSQRYCAITNAIKSAPPVPSLTPEQKSSLLNATSPVVGGFKQNCVYELHRLTPCIGDIKAYMRTNSSINSTCCATILDVGNQCHWDSWPKWFARSKDNCKNH